MFRGEVEPEVRGCVWAARGLRVAEAGRERGRHRPPPRVQCQGQNRNIREKKFMNLLFQMSVLSSYNRLKICSVYIHTLKIIPDTMSKDLKIHYKLSLQVMLNKIIE